MPKKLLILAVFLGFINECSSIKIKETRQRENRETLSEEKEIITDSQKYSFEVIAKVKGKKIDFNVIKKTHADEKTSGTYRDTYQVKRQLKTGIGFGLLFGVSTYGGLVGIPVIYMVAPLTPAIISISIIGTVAIGTSIYYAVYMTKAKDGKETKIVEDSEINKILSKTEPAKNGQLILQGESKFVLPVKNGIAQLSLVKIFGSKKSLSSDNYTAVYKNRDQKYEFSQFELLGILKKNGFSGKCIKGNCRNGKGMFIHSNGEKYIGSWKDHNKHGKGKYLYLDGSIYVGEFKNNKEHGWGILYYKGKKIKSGLWMYGEFKMEEKE